MRGRGAIISFWQRPIRRRRSEFPTLIEIIPRHNGSPLHRFGIFKLVLTKQEI
jgi:hypothetical protein